MPPWALRQDATEGYLALCSRRVAIWTPLTSHESLSYSRLNFFSLGLLDECVHLNLGNALLASNDIKRKKRKKTRGVNHLRSHLTRGCVFIYLSVSVIFPPRKCTFACLSTIRHNTNNPAITGGLSWPLKVSSSTEEWFSNSQVHIGLLSSRGPRKHHYS